MTVGTPICNACAVMAISARPPGEVEIIMVAMGSWKAQARPTATVIEARSTKHEFNSANGMNNLLCAKNARSYRAPNTSPNMSWANCVSHSGTAESWISFTVKAAPKKIGKSR